MRIHHSKSFKKSSKTGTNSTQSRGARRTGACVDRNDDRAEILARLEESEFAKGNTAGGRKPPYNPEYAERAKVMCERGATTDELAEVFGVSVVVISVWQRIHQDFFEACKLAPGCIERVKRSIFESAVGSVVRTEKSAVSGSQVQTVNSKENLPANFGAAKHFVSQKEFMEESDLVTLLKELQGTRVRPKCLLPGEKSDFE